MTYGYGLGTSPFAACGVACVSVVGCWVSRGSGLPRASVEVQGLAFATRLSSPRVTRHARKRSQQRGIQGKHVELIQRHADFRQRRPDGAKMLRVSRKKLLVLVRRGQIAPQDCDRLVRIVLIISGHDGSVLTTYHRAGSSGRSESF